MMAEEEKQLSEQVLEEVVLTHEEQRQADEDDVDSDKENLYPHYLSGDVLHKHLRRQANILNEALKGELEAPTTPGELTRAYEKHLFCPAAPPPKQENGTLQPNPRLNFYPTFIVPETLATYHLFFQNQRIPFSCKANRPSANQTLALGHDDFLPRFPAVEEIQKIFEGLGPEEVSKNALENENSHLVELEHDGPRVAVMKRNISITHFAYPALNLPPKIMSTVMDTLVMKPVEGKSQLEEQDKEEEQQQQGGDAVSDEELIRWLKLKDKPEAEVRERIAERRKTVMATVLVSVVLRSMERFFTAPEVIRKTGESLHYLFRHGYVRQACKISNVELTHLVTYMGILHENRVGQSTLHNSLSGENRLDYVRDTVFLFLMYTWQTAMGVWQQCLDPENLKELVKILEKHKRRFWCTENETMMASGLSDIIFPDEIVEILQKGLPDIVSQSMMQQFRDFILERSAILPAMSCALPSDFVPIHFKQCPPQLWPYTYLLHLANYFMYHNDLHVDSSGEGALLECYCRCNLCTPHRSLATNTALLNEVQAIGTFELARPPKEDGTEQPPLKLTPGMWTNAYLRKFEDKDYYPYQIRYYEDQKNPSSRAELKACVITQAGILAQLKEIKKAREEFLLKKGRGVYLDPQTGEELSGELGARQFGRDRELHGEDQKEHPDADSYYNPHGGRKSKALPPADSGSARGPRGRGAYQQSRRGGRRPLQQRGGGEHGRGELGGRCRGAGSPSGGPAEESAEKREALGPASC